MNEWKSRNKKFFNVQKKKINSIFSEQTDGFAIRKTKIFTFFVSPIVICWSVLSSGDSFDKYVCPPLGLFSSYCYSKCTRELKHQQQQQQ